MSALATPRRRILSAGKGFGFESGSEVRVGGDAYIIVGPLGCGGVGDVYKVKQKRSHRHFALKHLYGRYATDPETYYKKLGILAAHTPPHEAFVWPIALTPLDPATKSFCYVMPLVEDGFRPLAHAIIDRKLLTMEQRLAVCKKLTEAFASLRRLDWVYGDCSAKNFLYRLDRNGQVDVRIIDCDTVTKNRTGKKDTSFGLEGTGLYRAPEIFLGQAPTLHSDAHAFAAVMFHMLVGCNPLDGQKTRSEPFSESAVLKHFGKSPSFIFGERGNNLPLQPILTTRFYDLPEGVRAYFRVIFSQSKLKNPEARPGPDVLLKVINKT